MAGRPSGSVSDNVGHTPNEVESTDSILKITDAAQIGDCSTMTPLQEDRAWDIFQREFSQTRDPRLALRAAMVDLESRLFPEQHAQGVAMALRARPLLRRYRSLIESVCNFSHADFELTCSLRRARYGGPEVNARGVIVGIFTDLNLSARQISDGVGMSNSVVNNCRVMRPSRPDWEEMIAFHAPLVRQSR